MAKHANFASGDIVTIYEDPLTQQCPEGKAELLRFVGTDWSDGERWRIKFADGHICERWIYPD